jgi:aerobic C4-dicarboxylate transport protein
MSVTPAAPSAPAAPSRRRVLLNVQVLVGIIVGGFLGYLQPKWGVALRPLGDGFVNLVKILIAPIIFTTVVVGLAGMGDLKKVGRVLLKALLYFEVVTTIALVIGLVVANVFTPGAGFHADPATLDAKGAGHYTTAAGQMSAVDFLLHLIPRTFVSAFAAGRFCRCCCSPSFSGWRSGNSATTGARS